MEFDACFRVELVEFSVARSPPLTTAGYGADLVFTLFLCIIINGVNESTKFKKYTTSYHRLNLPLLMSIADNKTRNIIQTCAVTDSFKNTTLL